MQRYSLILSLLIVSHMLLAQGHKDTLVAQVGTHITGSTRDLSLLDVRVQSLKAGKSSPDEMAEIDQLLIVKDGNMTIKVGSLVKTLGPGGIALLPFGAAHSLTNTGHNPANYYVFSFLTDSRTGKAGQPVLLDWKDMTMKTTDKGESRQIFNQPVAFLNKIDMHATTLNEGQVSHPPHIHRNEEIILMRSGDVQMYIGGKYYPAHAGDIVFLTSGTPHALENKTKGRCEYFALQWQP